MENRSEQYYPTYKYIDRDILLLEFDEAQKIANGQTKVYGQVANLLLAIITVTFTLLFDNDFSIINDRENALARFPILSLFLFFFGLLLLRYFVDLQKQITINARKVVTLRTLLGLDYGGIQLTLPNWRVEGANNPFTIRYFHGWLSFRTMPFWLLTIAMNLVWWATLVDGSLSVAFINRSFVVPDYWGHVTITLVYLSIFRRHLNDRHETVYLNFVQVLATIIGVKLLDNFEYIIYRAKLAYIELERLKIKTNTLSSILIQIEDRSFEKHPGVSLKALVRAFLSRSRSLRRRMGILPNGGSTITMQLARTLFIPSNQNRYRRKVIEILLSFWLSNGFSKKDILKLYLGGVRFETGVQGLAKAMNHFFGELKVDVSNEEAFFLIERLSNVAATVNWKRIKKVLMRIDLPIDDKQLYALYLHQIKIGRLTWA